MNKSELKSIAARGEDSRLQFKLDIRNPILVSYVANPIQTSSRKPPNYEKPLGSKGNRNLEDYLIPVIKLMWNGHDHKEAFRIIKEKLNVRYNTVSSQCTRALGLTTEDFIERVESKTIVDLIEYKYPDQYQKIKSELKR